MPDIYNPKKQWTNKPPLLYAMLKIQELYARAQKAIIEDQLAQTQKLLNHELKKIKDGNK